MGETQKKQTDRQVFLDVLRVTATIAVVMMHTVSGVLYGYFDMNGYERRIKAFRAIIDATSWSVPIFLIVSGYLLLNPKKRITWKDTFLKYCRRIILVLILFGIPYAVLELVGYLHTFEWWMIPRGIKNTAMGRSWSHMWYCYLILILYLVTPLLKWILQKVPKAAVYAVMAILALGVSILPYIEVLFVWPRFLAIPDQGIYLFYFLCGYLWSVTEHRPNKKEGIACLSLFFVILLLEMGSRFVEGYELDMAYGYPPTLLAALLLFHACWTFQKLAAQRSKAEAGTSAFLLKVVAFMNPLCFGIYLIHPAFLNLFYKILKISIMNFRFYWGTPLFFCIAFFGAAFSTWVLRLIPPMRKYVL